MAEVLIVPAKLFGKLLRSQPIVVDFTNNLPCPLCRHTVFLTSFILIVDFG
nr:MAG TPA: Thioredoxin domain-containing protein 5 family member, thioredoxin domain [Caudoviricetes sp.]